MLDKSPKTYIVLITVELKHYAMQTNSTFAHLTDDGSQFVMRSIVYQNSWLVKMSSARNLCSILCNRNQVAEKYFFPKTQNLVDIEDKTSRRPCNIWYAQLNIPVETWISTRWQTRIFSVESAYVVQMNHYSKTTKTKKKQIEHIAL